ncbi:hypothetical protein RHMOL_Rhmol06G0209400 [Rhododendron molle]|uniref:Uncharacterized protein n=1 Tax=Rhododendron molle TaxID=49168 RepID=A0ACC0NEE7_RHOML|nr:hypothetical protein RHMOL_Rhmol06G0209400 [Rhododendron molle]
MKLFYGPHYSSFTPSDLRTSTPSKILQLCKSGSLSSALRLLNSLDSHEKTTLKPIIYAALLQACTKHHSLSIGLQIHAHAVKSGLETDHFIGNSLLAFYFKLGSDFSETRRVFDGLYVKDVVSWTSMISGYIRVGRPTNSVALFPEMLGFGVEPNGFTLSAVIKACSELGDLKMGRSFHGVVFRRGFGSDCVIISALMDFYRRSYEPGDARQLFDELLEPDGICWTSVMSALTRNDVFDEALWFFYLMQRDYGLLVDEFTFATVLTALGNLGRLRQGKEMHAKVVVAGIRGDVVVESSLVDMYGKCRVVEESRRVFERMAHKNSVSWCALLGGYCQKGLAAIRQGKEVHCRYLRKGDRRDVIVESALVDLYAKCGCIDFAYSIFKLMPARNLITWNSMICGFAQNGRGGEALRMFDEMVNEGIKPDYISFIGILFACSHTGLVDQGRKHFTSMSVKYGIKPGIEHYNCMIDLLGRAGEIEEAEKLVRNAELKRIPLFGQLFLVLAQLVRILLLQSTLPRK